VVVADEPFVSQKLYLLDRLRLTRLDEAQLNIALTTPVFDCRDGELRTVIQTQRLELSLQLDQSLKHPDHAVARSSSTLHRRRSSSDCLKSGEACARSPQVDLSSVVFFYARVILRDD
jgi:hypothetical protein